MALAKDRCFSPPSYRETRFAGRALEIAAARLDPVGDVAPPNRQIWILALLDFVRWASLHWNEREFER